MTLCVQATAVSTASQGRQTSRLGISRSDSTCSIGWCVGPSSPRPMESWVKHIDHALVHQRAHADGVAGIIGEHQEGGDIGQEAAVQRQAVGDRRHAELAHAEEDRVAGGIARDRLGQRMVGEVGMRRDRPSRRSVPAALSPRRQARSGWPCGWRWRRPSRRWWRPASAAVCGEIGRQIARTCGAGIPPPDPDRPRDRPRSGFCQSASSASPFSRGRPIRPRPRAGPRTARCGPAERLARARDFFRAERRAVGVLMALLGGRAAADHGLAADQASACRFRRRPRRARHRPPPGNGRRPRAPRASHRPRSAWACRRRTIR